MTETVTTEEALAPAPIKVDTEVLAGKEKEEWLGDEDSNLGRQIQSLSSYH